MNRVFAYLRVSTLEQKDKGGYARQKEVIDTFCGEKGWHIMRTFGDQQSGGDAFENRKQLQECLDLCTQATGVGAIVVERADRIARDMIEQEVFLREAARRKVLVYVAETGEELTTANATPDRKLIRRIMGALAEWEKDQTAKKLLAGRMRKARETGKPCGGPLPFGEAPNPARRACERAVIDFIMAEHKAGEAYSAIVLALRAQGFPAPGEGGKWSKGTVFRIVQREKWRLSNAKVGNPS